MMTVRNRVNMRAVYFILFLLLVACSKDDASEDPGNLNYKVYPLVRNRIRVPLKM